MHHVDLQQNLWAADISMTIKPSQRTGCFQDNGKILTYFDTSRREKQQNSLTNLMPHPSRRPWELGKRVDLGMTRLMGEKITRQCAWMNMFLNIYCYLSRRQHLMLYSHVCVYIYIHMHKTPAKRRQSNLKLLQFIHSIFSRVFMYSFTEYPSVNQHRCGHSDTHHLQILFLESSPHLSQFGELIYYLFIKLYGICLLYITLFAFYLHMVDIAAQQISQRSARIGRLQRSWAWSWRQELGMASFVMGTASSQGIL